MATSITISHEVYDVLTPGQRLCWFLDNYDAVYAPYANTRISAEEAKNTFMDCSDVYVTPDQAFQSNMRDMLSRMILGDVSHEKFVFVMVDSCVACEDRIQDVAQFAKDRFPTSQIVLVNTLVNTAENVFKDVNPERYAGKNVNFKRLEENISILSGKKDILVKVPKVYVDEDYDMESDAVFYANADMGPSDEIHVFQFPKVVEFGFLDETIGDFLDNNDNWFTGARQEINDKVQVQILVSLIEHLPGCSAVMFTHDNGMKEKLKLAQEISSLVYIGDRSGIY